MMFEEFGQDNKMDQVNQIATAMLEDKDAERINLPKDDVFRIWSYADKPSYGPYGQNPSADFEAIIARFIDKDTKTRFKPMLEDEGWNYAVGQGGGTSDRIYVIFYDEDKLLEMLDQDELWDCLDILKDELGTSDPDAEEEDFADIFFDEFTNEDDELESGEDVWEYKHRRKDLILEYIVFVLSMR